MHVQFMSSVSEVANLQSVTWDGFYLFLFLEFPRFPEQPYSQRCVQDSCNHLKQRVLQQQLKLKDLNHCFKALYSRCLQESWTHLWCGYSGNLGNFRKNYMWKSTQGNTGCKTVTSLTLIIHAQDQFQPFLAQVNNISICSFFFCV